MLNFSPPGSFPNNLNYSQPHILCVSGGKDSVYMAEVLSKRLNDFKTPPEIIHFNHGLRKKASLDQEFVQNLAVRLNLTCKVFKLKVKQLVQRKSLSTEEAARFLRYEALENYCSIKKEKGVILTAHTCSDQAETLLFRMVKGTGLEGLRGIPARRRLNAGWEIYRPLLGLTSGDVIKYLEDKKIAYREDESNLNNSIPRNLIRNRVIPELKKINPSLEKNIFASSQIFVQENEFIDREVQKALKNIKKPRKKNSVIIELKKILSYNDFLIRRILMKIAPVKMDFRSLKSACQLIRGSGCSKRIKIGSGWQLRKDYRFIFFEKEHPVPEKFCYILNPGDEIKIPGPALKVGASISDTSPPLDERREIEVFDAGKFNKSLKVRSRRPGDRIKLLGGGTKKLKDILIDDKVPLRKRNRGCVFEYGGKIIWFAPFRRSSFAPVRKNTGKTLVLKVSYE